MPESVEPATPAAETPASPGPADDGIGTLLRYTPAFMNPPAQSGTDQSSPRNDAVLLRLATRASVTVAVLLIAAKAIAYASTGAVSILASLIDSSMDAVASLVNLLAVRYALVPADREHRFGHGKAEALAALGQCLLIILSSLYLASEAVGRLRDPQPVEAVGAGIVVMLISLAATAGLLLLLHYVVRRTHSAAIRADALHYRGDLLGNSAVLLALFLSQAGVQGADPVLALAIAVYLIASTRGILSQSLDELLDRELPAQQRDAIIATARAHPRVHGVHGVRTRRSGRNRIVQMHIELDDELPLREAHDIADEVEYAIRREHPGSDVVIHQDPVGLMETHPFTRQE